MHMPCEDCGIGPAVEGGGGLCGECDAAANLSDFDDHEPFDDDEECYECGGEGFVVDDCFEDTCCCADPETEHGIIPCPNCS